MKLKLLEAVVIGLPNAGKSTFINAVMRNNSIFAVSNKPHTTREVNLASLQYEDVHIILFDTPGLSRTVECMIDQVTKLADSKDLCIFVFDVSKPLSTYLQNLADSITKPKVALLNKSDLISKGSLLPIVDTLKGKFQDIIPMSALKGENIEYVLNILKNYAKRESEQEVFETNRSFVRRIMDRTYESILHHTHHEIPYSVNIDTPIVEERPDGSVKIIQYIHVRPSHYPIILGMIKNISVYARMRLIEMFKKNVHYYLEVRKIEKQ